MIDPDNAWPGATRYTATLKTTPQLAAALMAPCPNNLKKTHVRRK